MIFNSVPTMIALDLAIIVLVAGMLIASWWFGLFSKGRLPRSGRLLIPGGVALTGLFYLVDLITMTVSPTLVGIDRSMALMNMLHLDARWLVSLVSVILIGSGVVVTSYYRQRGEDQLQQAETQISNAQDRIIESEIRFRALVEQTPDAVYCFEFNPPVRVNLPIEEQIARSHDAVLVECNQVFAASIGDKPAGALVGLRFGDMDSALDTETHNRYFRDFIENGYRLVDYELKYTNIENKPCALQISVSGVVRQGELVRMWGAEKSILEESKTKAALAGRLHFQRFVADMSASLLTAPEPESEKVLTQCLQQAARYIGTHRAKLVVYDETTTFVARRYSWMMEGQKPIKVLSPDNFPKIWRTTLLGDTFVLGNIDELAAAAQEDAETVVALGVKASVFVPLVVAGEVLGTSIFSDYSETRAWNDQEINDLKVLVNLMANKIVQINGRESLNAALSKLQIATSRLEAENKLLREEISATHGFEEIIGESDSLKWALQQVEKVAPTAAPVLLQGETGTGKELVAQAIHNRSDRKDEPIIKVNCAALPATLIEGELFGHERGAFTGATNRKPGRFDLADGGTLFLDEVADLPLELQSKLLRVLQSGEFERLGGSETLSVDVRIIAATNRDLQIAVDKGEFRPDLFYRIGTFPITLPPLRSRPGDIALLAEHFVRKHAPNLQKDVAAISAVMLDRLNRYDWPGNVRELEGVVQRALISSSGPVLKLAESQHSEAFSTDSSSASPMVESTDLQSVEREHITRILQQTDWVVGGETGAATLLGLPASTLRSRMKKLGIRKIA